MTNIISILNFGLNLPSSHCSNSTIPYLNREVLHLNPLKVWTIPGGGEGFSDDEAAVFQKSWMWRYFNKKVEKRAHQCIVLNCTEENVFTKSLVLGAAGKSPGNFRVRSSGKIQKKSSDIAEHSG